MLWGVTEFSRLQIYIFCLFVSQSYMIFTKGEGYINCFLTKINVNISDYCYFPQPTIGDFIKVRKINKSHHFVFKIKKLELSRR